jgi:hypothetical protein
MSDVKQLKIEEYSLVDFIMKIQQGIRDGYEVNDSSDDAPIQIGGAFHLIMRESAKPNITVGKLVMEASFDTTKLQEQLKAGGEIEQMLTDSLVVDEKLHDLSIDPEKDADKWDNKELGADEAYVETIEPPKEPTLDESLPKEEQVVQTKQVTIAATTTPKRGKKQ